MGDRHELLDSAMEELTERERDIIQARRLQDEPATLEELSQKYGVRRERVRQIEVRAFEKLQAAMQTRGGLIRADRRFAAAPVALSFAFHRETAMTLKLWQVDAFASKVLEGNPAAIVPLERWLDDALMQRIAGENNLAETAFFVKTAPGRYDLRWFTPNAEVDLCGHATLASAWVIFDHAATRR